MRRLGILVIAVTAACAAPNEVPTHLVTGLVTAGPVCPVVTDPPDPNCADRPVAGATIRFAGDKDLWFEATTGADGRFQVALPDGNYEGLPQPVEGLLGTAPSFLVTVAGGPIDLGVISYDTGIR